MSLSKKKYSFWQTIVMFLAVLGPGIITANVDNDAGGIATYSLAGAHFGYSLLWVFIPITISLVVVQEMSVRMGAVTGKGLGDLIREEYGVKAIVFVMVGLLINNMGTTVAEFAGIAASMEIFGISKYVSVPISAFLVWWIIVKGTYNQVEKIFLVASSLYISYIISGFLSKPQWGEVASAALHPTFQMNTTYLMMVIGMVGTTISPWMQFYIQSAVVEKGITVKELKHSRIDVVVGSIFQALVALFIVIACAATLYKNHIQINDARDAALALKPLAGKFASELFAFGLFNASFFAASILPLSTAYYICEALGFEAGVDKSFSEAKVFYWLYTILIVLGAGMILIPGLSLITIMYISQVVNGFLLPAVLIYILKLINNPDVMGEYVNEGSLNIIAWLTCVITIVLSGLLVVSVIFPGIFS